jgi:hypothetical protein
MHIAPVLYISAVLPISFYLTRTVNLAHRKLFNIVSKKITGQPMKQSIVSSGFVSFVPASAFCSAIINRGTLNITNHIYQKEHI